jgi:hypothetical protein
VIPRTSGGRGFKGAAAYYLHDKKAQTTGRVRFTHSINLSSNEPGQAINEMCWTAYHAEDLKIAAGVKGGGRKLEKPVYTLSLSWHPSENPTDQHMIEAGLSALKALKMDHHQVLMVAHNDTEHPHVHLIVNRVDSETGKAHGLNKDQLILSKWAQAYEQEHGQNFCQARVQNNAERKEASIQKAQGARKNAFVKDKEGQKREHQRDYARRAMEAKARAAAAEKAREARAFAEREAKARADKFEQWASAQLNRLQDRQLEQRGIAGHQWAQRRERVEVTIERQYGKDSRADAARLAELTEKQRRGNWLSRYMGRQRGEDAEREALKKNLDNAQMRSQEMRDAVQVKEQAAKAFLAEQHRQEREQLDARIERGRAEGYTIPGPDAAREKALARERSRGQEPDLSQRDYGRG